MLFAALLAAAAAGPLGAQDPMSVEPLPQAGDTVEWHVVQSGETLLGITLATLGTGTLWRENHRLNPKIRDPDLLSIGQRIRIITARELAVRDAEVTLVSRVVKAQRFPDRTESDAKVGDRLREKDGIRTERSSSAELTFSPESRLLIGERSLVILERVDSNLRGVRRESIEIRRGEAEVVARPARADRSEIEIMVGNTRARPRTDASGTLQIRSRKAGEGGGAKVMVYGGRSDVEAAGSVVRVARGMGTSVPEGGPPAAPERLLPAPTPLLAAATTWPYSNPVLRWAQLDGAQSYRVEVCSDRSCSGVIAQAKGLREPRWSPDRLPAGELFWRVSAVSPSGLDGYPSRSRRLLISTPEPDVAPPRLSVELRGTGRVEPGSVLLAADGSLEPVAEDPLSGVAAIRYRWDGGPWQVWKGKGLVPPAGEPRRLEVQAEDRRGHVSESWSARVLRDATPPEPPRVEWAGPVDIGLDTDDG